MMNGSPLHSEFQFTRRGLLKQGGAVGLALAAFPYSGSAYGATVDDRALAAALARALLPAYLGQDAAARYPAFRSELDSELATSLRNALGDVQSELRVDLASGAPKAIRRALATWNPKARVTPPPTVGDPPAMRMAAVRLMGAPDLDDPSTWTGGDAVAFAGDHAYQQALSLTASEAVAARRLTLVRSLVDTLASRALADRGDAPTYYHGVELLDV